MVNLQKAITDHDTNVGWTRTTVNAAISGLIAWLIGNTTWFDFLGDIDLNDFSVVFAVGIISGVVWRASILVSRLVPLAGWVLFGINKPPDYDEPTPPNPPTPDDPPREV